MLSLGMLVPGKGQTKYDIEELYDEETGVLCMRQVRLNGLLHAPNGNTPSHAAYDEEGNPVLLKWHWQNKEHREGKPSSIWFHEGTNSPRIEVFENYGEPRPEYEGPHIIHYDVNGQIEESSTAKDWYRNRGGRPRKEKGTPST